MRKILSLFLIPAVIFYACKPEGSTEVPRVRPEDPKALSSAIKVWHGVRANGNLPASTNSPAAPVLGQTNTLKVLAIAGRYAIVMPDILSGSVAGYYVKVNGATDYFKVDYSKPRNIDGRFAAPVRKSRHNSAMYRGLGIDSTGGGGIQDSAIVIVIPPVIQPGEFCITYCAYDASGNVSNTVSVCITVTSFGGDASFHGTWHITGFSDDTTTGWDPLFGVGDTIWSSGFCRNNRVVDTFGSGPGIFPYPWYIYEVAQADLNFASNGGMNYAYSESIKEFDFINSTCSNYLFHTDTDADAISGAWSYNSTDKTMVLIFEFDDTGVAAAEAYEYKVTKVSGNKFYLYDPIDDTWLRLEK